ncbi:MAG TPA: LPXTG cell wall anchor domain-containing protein [Terriglobales bacterium]|nr:LPXTG cell wall anchor domain-containing protein [Terriglobales bacterium]
MFSRFLVSVLVLAASCFAQVSTTGGYATTSQSSMAGAVLSSDNPPLVSTPDIALPGSGPAVGAPLSSAAANDSRFSTGPSVHSANAIAPQVSGDNGTLAFGLPANESVQTSEPSAGAQNFEFGIQHFESGLTSANAPVSSLGQIARNYRAQHHKAARSFNNDSISQLNAAGVRTGNLGPESSNTVATATQPPAMQPASGGTLIAANQPPALPQGDQDQSAPAGQSVRPSATASQQRHKVETPAPAAAQNSAVTTQDSSASQNAQQKGSAKLPQTASSLPLIFLIGGLGLAGGALYLLRR